MNDRELDLLDAHKRHTCKPDCYFDPPHRIEILIHAEGYTQDHADYGREAYFHVAFYWIPQDRQVREEFVLPTGRVSTMYYSDLQFRGKELIL